MKEKRYLDLLSIIAAFSVIILHVNGVFWEFSSTQSYWKSALIIESVFYFAVPVFFMISGATLMDFYERYGLGVYFKKRAVKTFVPFLFWSIMGLIVHVVFFKDIPVEALVFRNIFNGLMAFSSFVPVFWFFRPLFISYLAIPVFAGVEKSKKLKIFTYIAVTALILDFLFPFLNSCFKIRVNPNIVTIVGSYYLIFLFLGYIIDSVELKITARVLIYLGGLAGLGFQLFGTYIRSMKAGAVDTAFKEYTNIPAILQGVAFFVFIKYAYRFIEKNKIVNKLIDVLRKYTFSFFLLHWFVIQGLIKIFNIDQYSILWRLFGFIPAAAICMGIAWALRRVKVGRLILP